MTITVLTIVGLFIFSSILIGYILSAPSYQGEKTDHFNGKQFINPANIKAKGFKDLLKWAMNRHPGEWEKIEKSNKGIFQKQTPDSITRVYYVNHSTFLIQSGHLNLLIDPVWSDRVSPFSWLGPQRMRPPGIKFEELPDIDLVLISHNHYDHLDIPTLLKIQKDFSPLIITPLGVSKLLLKKGLENCIEMDWWQNQKINDQVDIVCVPAQHFSGRGMFDRDKTLWAGYILKFPQGNIYFAGDTGYGDFIKKIGREFGPIKLSLLPIGAYLPKWFMSPIHTSPEDAVKIHLDLDAEKSIGMHYGTFPLADDGMYQPVEDLQAAKIKFRVSDFLILENGEFVDLE